MEQTENVSRIERNPDVTRQRILEAAFMEIYRNGFQGMRLDEVLSVAAGVDEGTDGLTEAGRSVMDVWEKLDTGAIADSSDAFDEADRRVREQHSAAAEE